VVSYTFLILNPWEKALGSHGIGGSVGPTANGDILEKKSAFWPCQA